MRQIHVSARCKIHPGKLDAFKTAANACVVAVREMDKGTLQYDWFLSEDRTECVVRETYRDSDAVLSHVQNLGDQIGAVLALCDFRLEVYGDVSPELRKLLQNFPHTIYGYHQGL